MRAVQLVGAVGDDDQQAAVAALVADQEGQQVTGGPVGPVGVLDDQHDRLVLGQPLQQPEHLLEQPRPRLRPVLVGLAELGQQPRQLPGRAARHEPGDAVPPERAYETAQHGGERRERQPLGAQLQAPADEHQGVIGTLGQLTDQACLADSRLAADEHGGRRPGPRPVEGVAEHGQLAGPPDEQGAHRMDTHAPKYATRSRQGQRRTLRKNVADAS